MTIPISSSDKTYALSFCASMFSVLNASSLPLQIGMGADSLRDD